MTVDADAEKLWVDEVQRRYDAYQTGELEARPGDEVMARVRKRLKSLATVDRLQHHRS